MGNVSLPGSIDIGLQVRAEDSLPASFVSAEISGHKHPAGIVGHVVHSQQWADVKDYLDRNAVPHAWHFMQGDDTSRHQCNGADWC
jgi:hypothetical protein